MGEGERPRTCHSATPIRSAKRRSSGESWGGGGGGVGGGLGEVRAEMDASYRGKTGAVWGWGGAQGVGGGQGV